ncbi:MAG: 3-dehydroquinate synthase [Leptolyngbyaceae cyanobacterium CSU_1_3]|nr:3-dehydroquinate synthase [Leptolyngbyaceae cyanobacterium CSU_1_3]
MNLTTLRPNIVTALPAPQPLHQSLTVTFTYDVHFTSGLFQTENLLLAQAVNSDRTEDPKRVLVVIDAGVVQSHSHLLAQIREYVRFHADALTLAGEPVIVPGGESVKNSPDWVNLIHQTVEQVGLCRHSSVMAIGGGAVLDMAGYAAATAHRGIRLIRVPTTVLAQNDSGIGVKNGINAFGKKNFLGTFAPPTIVLNDFNFLTTLDDRDWRSGIAEAIKVALIKDAKFFDFIETHATELAQRNMAAMQQLIYHCASHHLNHIGNYGDPFEMGSSRPLDFGHWAAHRLEHLTHYALRHGEAVAIGIALDTTYAFLLGLLSPFAWKRVLETLQELGFKLYVPELDNYLDQPDHPESIFRGLGEFREHLGGELTLTLLSEIGRGIEVHEVDLTLYQQAIALLQTF